MEVFQAYARATSPKPDIKGVVNGSSAIDIHPFYLLSYPHLDCPTLNSQKDTPPISTKQAQYNSPCQLLQVLASYR